ncbi:bifunctional metallophosphatase/5'-nucleotidase [Myxococcaceae bacterium JPH2]|nr:bifunctional metallophosphatase/5'-nucleotidase [Myxococcaceae bacterium JPH2]
MPRSLRTTAVLLAALASACRGGPVPTPPGLPPASPTSDAPLRLTLVGTNDFHGWVGARRQTLPDGQVVEEGGAANYGGYVARLRQDNPGGVFLVDAGDLFQGTLPSNLTEGALVVDVYNYLGYAAAALGNHEFDYGPEGPSPIATHPGEDPLGALKVRVKQARFPFLAANLREADGQRPAWTGNDGTALVTVQGVKVGILGLSTPSTPQTTNPANVAALRFQPMLPVTLAAAQSLRARGAEVVVITAHAGGHCAKLEDPRDTSSCDRQDGEIYALLEALPPGTVDAVVAGHTHQPMGHFFGDVPVIETSGQSRSFGVVDLYVDPRTHRVRPELTRIQAAVPVCPRVDEATGSCDAAVLREQRSVHLVPATFRGGPVTPDAQVEVVMAPTLARVAAMQRAPVGVTATEKLLRAYESEGTLGNLIADALRSVAGADVAVMNAGGLRADLAAGPLTFGDVYEVLPFDNRLALLNLSGAELRRLLSLGYGSRKGVFAVSGVRVTLDTCQGPQRLQAVTLSDGRPLEPTVMYRVALPDFLARGGDGVGPLTDTLPPERVDLARGEDLRQVLIAHGRAHGGTLVPPQVGRVIFTPPQGACPNAGH